jgi:hypothetical protein
MTIRSCLAQGSIAVGLAACLTSVSMSGAWAANVVTRPDADFSAAPYTIDFGSGMDAATFTFSIIPNNDGVTVDQVSTGGNGLVDSFLSQPIPFQLGILVGSGDTFTAFPAPAPILFSAAEDDIGLEFRLSDGVHFGYVTTLGPEVLQYGYNAAPGGFIVTGSSVPEPSTWTMLIVGLGALAMMARVGKRISVPRAIAR